jgi:predicted O-methyltransferase YrrM
MNQILREILNTGIVRDGENSVPLHDNMTEEDCGLITEAIQTVKPRVSLEIGFGCGISTLFVCDALAANTDECKHIVIDPHQKTIFRNIGLQNIKRAGFEHMIEVHEAPSELALPRLLAKGTRIQAAIIDGWHTFDHALVDFFYVNKMLEEGGIVVLDDANLPSIFRLTQHIRTYPAYEPFARRDTRPSTPRFRTKVRRAMSRVLPNLASLKRSWDYPRCVAFRKVMPDTRSWDWHVEFLWHLGTMAYSAALAAT